MWVTSAMWRLLLGSMPPVMPLVRRAIPGSWPLRGAPAFGEKGMLAAAKAMAHAAVTVLKDPDLLEKAREEHQKTTGGVYVCAVPDDVKPDIEGIL